MVIVRVLLLSLLSLSLSGCETDEEGGLCTYLGSCGDSGGNTDTSGGDMEHSGPGHDIGVDVDHSGY